VGEEQDECKGCPRAHLVDGVELLDGLSDLVDVTLRATWGLA